MTGKRNLFLGLLIGAVLGGGIWASLPLSDSTSAQCSRTVQLRQGWNQLVWTARNQAAHEVLDAIAGDLVIAYGWQGYSQTFSRYIPGRADASTMRQVEMDSAYWLLMSRDVAFSVPSRCALPLPLPIASCPTSTPCPSCDYQQELADYWEGRAEHWFDLYNTCVADLLSGLLCRDPLPYVSCHNDRCTCWCGTKSWSASCW